MKIVGISDLHGYLDESLYINTDVLCICGDIVPLEIQNNISESWNWFENDFLTFCKEYPSKRVIFIGGNHDFFLDRADSAVKVRKIIADNYLSNKVIYLFDSGVEYLGKWFWGCPYVNMPGWAFNSKDDMHFSGIPDCNVLLTHAPIPGETGTVKKGFQCGRDFGSKSLFDALKGRKIDYHLCGHVHSGEHTGVNVNGTMVYNVSILCENYKPTYQPLQVEL